MAGLAVLFAGCGVGPVGRPSKAPPLPADQLVLMVQGWGGMVPPFDLALSTPGISLYGDGRLVTFVEGPYSPGLPAAYEVARADPAEVAGLVNDAETRAVVSENTDYGSPPVTDMPVTTVRLHGTGAAQEADVYAFADDFEGDVSWRQRRARVALRTLLDRAVELPGDAAPQPYPVDQVRVVELAPGSSGGPAVPWPGPDPDTFLRPVASPGASLACGILTGPAAGRAFAAARTNPNGVWSVAGEPRVFAVATLLPGADGCDR